MIFDTHAHYLDNRFDNDREELINSLESNNVKNVVEVSAAIEDCDKIIEFIDKYDNFYGTLGVHPSEVENLNEADMDKIKILSEHEKIVAIGEIGLDYHFDDNPEPELQRKWFIRQLELANELKLPVSIHSRDAAKETYDILLEHHRGSGREPKDGFMGGVIHCFSYSPEMASEFVKLGYFIGLDGPVTFKNSKASKEVARIVPEDRIVVETDSPYLSPEPLRGSRNSSINLKYVIDTIAEIRDVTSHEMEEILYNNAKRLYKIDKYNPDK